MTTVYPQTGLLQQTEIVTVATTITANNRQPHATHNYASVEFFSDAAGTPASASAGTVTLTITTIQNPQNTEAITDTSGVITAATPTTLGWSGNTKTIIATPDSIGTATHWRLNFSANRN